MIRRRCVVTLAAAGLLLGGCGIESTGVFDGPDAPTGVAAGPTLYFIDERGELRPNPMESGRLGDVTGAVDLLLRIGDPASGGLRSDLPQVESLGPQVTVTDSVLTVMLPLTREETGSQGVDQVVCTALGVRRQSGDTRVTEAVLSFTDGTRTEPRTCPVL